VVISATTEFIRDLDDSALLTNTGDFPTSRAPTQPKAFSEIRRENGAGKDAEDDEDMDDKDDVMADYVAERTPMSEKESFSRGSSVEPSNSESVRASGCADSCLIENSVSFILFSVCLFCFPFSSLLL